MPISLEELKKQGEIKTIYHPTISLEDLQKQGSIKLGQATPPEPTTRNFNPLGDSTLGQAVTGAGKFGFNLLKSASGLGERILQAPLKAIGLMPKGKTPTSAEQLQSIFEKSKNIAYGSALNYQGGTQKTVGGALNVASYFAPTGLETGAVKIADTAIGASKLLSKAPVLKGAFRIGASALASGSSMAGVTALQGGNNQDVKNAFLGGSFAGAVSKSFSLAAPTVLNSLAKASFKLTPSAAAKVGAKADSAASFVTKNNLSLNPKTQYIQASEINTKLESSLQKSLGNKLGVSPEEVKVELGKVVEQFKNDPAIYQEIKIDVAKAVKTLDETKGYNITLSELLSGKRSYGRSAFGKSSAVVKTAGVVSEGDYAIEQAYQNVLESALKRAKGGINVTPEIKSLFPGKSKVTMGEFNKVYSSAINAKKFSNLAQVKKDTQLVGRLFGLWAGEAVGQTIAPGLGGRLVGGMTGELLSTRLPNLIRQSTAGVVKSPKLLINATKIGTGLSPKNQ